MHIALYREFRPVTFDELIGQDHIVRILKNQIRTGNTSHAYLFSGTRGTGKTTTARILAKALNCTGEGEKPCGQCEHCRSFADGSLVDVIEMDAASHRGVNDIHEITDSVMYAPAAGKYKVYIIDEVHMLSNEAFNALLKTLEEPPEHVVFILATTEPQKVPATILSRCMKLDFRRVSENQLVGNMQSICEKKGIEAEQGALSLIAVSADGSVRDSLSILEQCICPGEPLRRDDVAAVLGTAGVEPLLRLTDLVLTRDPSGALLCLNDILSSGAETRQFMKEWLEHFRNLLIAKYVQNPSDILNMSTENAKRVTEQSEQISQQMLDRAVRELTETISLTKWAKHPRVMLEMSIVKLAAPEETVRTAGAGDSSESRKRADSLGQFSTGRQGSLPSSDRRNATQSGPSQAPLRNAPPGAGQPGQAAPPEIRQMASSMPPGPNPPMVDPAEFPEYVEAPADEEISLSEGSSYDDPVFDAASFSSPNQWETDDQIRPAQQEDRAALNPPDQQSSGKPGVAPSQNQQEAPVQDPGRNRFPAFSETDWEHVVDLAASSKGLLTRLMGRTHFREERDGRVHIICDDSTTAELLRSRGKETVEQILQQTAGRALQVVVEIREQGRESRRERFEEEQAELNRFFGREVPIK